MNFLSIDNLSQTRCLRLCTVSREALTRVFVLGFL